MDRRDGTPVGSSPALAGQRRESVLLTSDCVNMISYENPARLFAGIPALWTLTGNVDAQELDVAYVVTPEEVVDIMMDMAEVGPGDYVVDLGTGDGRLAIAAVELGAVGLGVDLDPRRVEEANENATKAGVRDRVLFLKQDLFDTDFSHASVVTLFLNGEVNLRLRSALLEQLEPGARVVSHNFDMGEWQPDKYQQYLRESNDSFYVHDIYCWIIPADVRGRWKGELGLDGFQMMVEQQFQNIEAEIHLDNRSLVTGEASLYGRRLHISARDPVDRTDYLFDGSIEGEGITGVVQVRGEDGPAVIQWQASRGPM